MKISLPASLSNIGAVELPAEMEKHITRFDFVLGRSRKANVNCGVVGYRGKIVITLSSSAEEQRVEDEFFWKTAESRPRYRPRLQYRHEPRRPGGKRR